MTPITLITPRVSRVTGDTRARLRARDRRPNPRHFHVRDRFVRVAVGNRASRPWFGPSCPPECPGLLPGETYETAEQFWRVR